MSFTTPLVGALLSAATLCVVVYINFVKPKLRIWHLSQPIRAFFVIDVNDKQEETYKLELPAYSEQAVQLRLEPLANFRCDVLKFGFYGDEATRPNPVSVLNTFIKKGPRREESPDTNFSHYIDDKDCYVIQAPREYTLNNNVAIGYVVKTQSPGRFKVKLLLATESGEGRGLMDLFVTVVAANPPQLAN